MKKKMLFMAAIAGLISLGSCVKDDVSGSVEAVRNAKANQLNGQANLANAQAELASAQAALTKATTSAQVALQTAQAASAAAQARIDEANAKLKEDALAQELAAILAGYKADTARDDARLQTELNNLAAALRTAQISQLTDAQNVLAAYQTAFNNFTNAQAAVVAAEVALETAKIAPQYAEKIQAALILAEEKEIKKQTTILEGLNNTEVEGMTPEEAQAAADAMQGDIDVATAKFDNDESGKIAELVAAAKAWANAFVAFKAAEAAYADLNDEVANELGVGNVYYDAINPGTSESVKNGINLGKVAGYSHAGGVVYNGDIKDAEGNVLLASGWNNTDVPVNGSYRVNEHGKYLFDNYVAAHPTATTDALNAAKKTLADDQDALGKSTDTKDTKTTRPANKTGDDQNPTLYAAKIIADNALTKAKAEYDAAKENKTKLPAAVKSAFKDMWDVYDKTSSSDEKKATALYKFAKAVEAAYGESNYNHLPATIDLSLAADMDEVVNYLMGSAGHDFDADTWNTKADIEALFATGSPLFVGTAFVAPAAFDIEDFDDYFDGITGITAATRKAGAKDYNDLFTDAETKLGSKTDTTPLTAYGAAYVAATNITKMQEKLTIDQDNINTAQDNVDTTAADVAKWEALIAAADADAYAAAVKALNEAVADFDEAVAALDAEEFASVTALELEQLNYLLIATQDVETLKANAEAALATAQQNLANLKDNVDQKDTIAAAEAVLVQAENDLAIATAELAVAQKALEALDIEIDLDGEDEPETPAEEPAEEPAEGGEETPAEGEGEAEGGEEA